MRLGCTNVMTITLFFSLTKHMNFHTIWDSDVSSGQVLPPNKFRLGQGLL